MGAGWDRGVGRLWPRARKDDRLSPELQHTLLRSARFGGVAVHSGESVEVEVQPAPPGSGIRFLRRPCAKGEGSIEATPQAVCHTRLGTVIGNADGVTVSTVEHLMAALWALAIDNALVVINGGEVPILDGSAAPILAALDRAGRRPQQAARGHLEILAEVLVTEGSSEAFLAPAECFEMAVEIDFASPAIGRQRLELAMDGAVFRRELADCRTFGFSEDVEMLRSAGLARGGSLDNVVVIENGQVLNPGGLRRADEFVRHKTLDAIGDLYLLGKPLIGRYQSRRGGHGLNNALTRALLARPEAWRLVEAPQALARAG